VKQRMKPNLKEKDGYHSREHDEDPTCHKTHGGDTPCEPVVFLGDRCITRSNAGDCG